MKYFHFQTKHWRRGFTLVELMITIVVLSAAGGIAYVVLSSGLTLYAKNVALNLSAGSMRSAIDRLLLDVQNASNAPTLINASGAVVTSGSAAGIRYDGYLGGPYVIRPEDNSNKLSTSGKVIKITRHTHPLASPPLPQKGDVLVINGHNTNRLVIASVGEDAKTYSENSKHTITLNLKSTIGGQQIDLTRSITTAYLTRRSAMVVAQGAGGLELRHYPNAEDVSGASGYGDPKNYRVISTTINDANDGATPFQVETIDGDPILSVNLSIRETKSGNYLSSRQKTDANDYLFIKTLTRPKTSL